MGLAELEGLLEPRVKICRVVELLGILEEKDRLLLNKILEAKHSNGRFKIPVSKIQSSMAEMGYQLDERHFYEHRNGSCACSEVKR